MRRIEKKIEDKLILKTIKDFVKAYLTDGGLEPELSPESFYVDFEIAMISAISEIFPGARVNNCFFHTLQKIMPIRF